MEGYESSRVESSESQMNLFRRSTTSRKQYGWTMVGGDGDGEAMVMVMVMVMGMAVNMFGEINNRTMHACMHTCPQLSAASNKKIKSISSSKMLC